MQIVWNMQSVTRRSRRLLLLGVDYFVFRLVASAAAEPSEPVWLRALAIALVVLAIVVFVATVGALWATRSTSATSGWTAGSATLSVLLIGLYAIGSVSEGDLNRIKVLTCMALIPALVLWSIELVRRRRFRCR